MKQNANIRLLALLQVCAMTLGSCPAALATETVGADSVIAEMQETANQLPESTMESAQTSAQTEVSAAAPLIINQMYGGGGKGDTPFTHSFIELYNPTAADVELSGYQLNYSSNRDQSKKDHAGSTTPKGGETQIVSLPLSGTIPAHSSFLVRCAAETTTEASLKYTIDNYDQAWEQVIDNDQTVVLTLTKGDTYVDGISTRENAPLAEEGNTLATEDISKQKSVRRIDFSDTNQNGSDFELLTWNAADVDDAFIDANRPRSLRDGEWPVEGNESGTAIESLTIQPGETQDSINLTWYAPKETVSAQVKFDGTEYPVTVSDLHVPTEVKTDKYTDTGKKVCKTTVSGLRANTKYTYQISNDGENWSKEYTYKTPKADSFTFAFTSDPQIKENEETNGKKPEGVSSGWDTADSKNSTGWAKMMEVIGKTGATLVVSAGDQVEDQSWGKSSEYEAFFAPEEMTSIAYAPAVGNHDRHYMFDDHFNLPNEIEVAKDGTEGDSDSLTQVKTTFRGQNSGTSQSHGNYIQEMPGDSNSSSGVSKNENGIFDFTERREMETKGNYYYLYDNVLFITLNTGAYPGGNDEESGVESGKADNSEAEAMVANFRKTIDAAKKEYKDKYNWIIVAHHKSTQTVAKHAADSDIENYVDAGFEKLMADEGVDFVLGGHDHVYSRSYVLNGDGSRASERLDTINDPNGVIYITGNCCSDMQYYTPFQTVDKDNNADYPVLANGETGSQAYLKGQNAANPSEYLPVGNQEWNQEYSPSYALFTVEGNTISVKAYNLDGDSETPTSKEIDAFTVTKNADGGEKSTGFENENASLQLEQIGRYDAGMTNADGGVMEIVDYNSKTGWSYAVNGQAGVLTAIPLNASKSKLTSGSTVDLLDGYNIDVKALVSVEGFNYGDMTSVAVSPDGTKLAAAIQAKDYAENGRVAIFTCNTDGTLTFENAIETGVQPDMVTFTPDGSKILTANEGEPRLGYGDGLIDPAGSVTIVDTASEKPMTVGFTKYDDSTSRKALTDAGVVLKKDTKPSVDLEPEYIACTNKTAYISCQEANAIAVLDLSSKQYTGVYSVGFEDYSKIAVDIDKKDVTYAPKTYSSLSGIRMPDGISLITIGGTDYLMTANEGDSRAWPVEDTVFNGTTIEAESSINEDERNFGKGQTSPTGAITSETGLTGKVLFFDASQYDGLSSEKDYLFGGRSFTMFKVTDNGLEEVFDSANDFEAKTAAYLPEYFNCSNDSLDFDDRSGKKGPEPETVVTGTVNDKTYAFVTLERIGGIMVYDITNPANVTYVNYINSRDFIHVDKDGIGVDDSPEGLKFVPASKSPTGNALLLAACEVGGTVAAYELQGKNIVKLPFEDVDEKDYFFEAVKWAVENGVTAGTSATTFSPNASCTRAQAVTFLWNAAGKPAPKSTKMPFVDVSSDSYYYNAVLWAVENGITAGTSATTFSPDAICTRAHAVTFLWNAAGKPATKSMKMPFADVSRSSYYYNTVLWAVENGITAGTSATTFSPDQNCTRAQIVSFLYRSKNV